ncbi:MAG: 16S rRNA processing protein RimM [Maricaulaceae bacterium]|nr:16S rRNA processing protein RimM [Maricaulaceae bacterium]
MAKDDAPAGYVCVAVIAGAHGVRGEAKVKSFTALPEDCFTYGPWLDAAGAKLLTPKRWKRAGDGFVVTLAEPVSREQILALKGARLHAPRAALPELGDPDEFYHHDLIGLEVRDLDGEPLGRVRAVHDFGAGEMLEVEGTRGVKGSWMLPFTRANVPEVRLGLGYLVADPPEIAPDEAAPEAEEETQ